MFTGLDFLQFAIFKSTLLFILLYIFPLWGRPQSLISLLVVSQDYLELLFRESFLIIAPQTNAEDSLKPSHFNYD